MNTNRPRLFKEPSTTVLVLGDVNERVVEKLNSLLSIHGPRGLRIVVVSRNTVKNFEALREFILSNITFTLELYFADPESAKNYTTSTGVVSILASDINYVNHLPPELKNLVEVV